MGFLNKGYRADKLQTEKKTKAHLKAFYKIMDDMQELADKADLSIEYNEENINDHIDYRELDHMEKFVLLGKIHNRQDGQTKDNDN